MPFQNINTNVKFLGAYIQRVSCSAGFNSQPTNVEVTLIEGNKASDIGASSFQQALAEPGRISGFSYSGSSFKFMGVIESWSKSFSAGGLTYNVKLSDPRIYFKDISVILNGNGPTGIPNILNAYAYYGSPLAADSTNDGMTFVKIRDYLSATGVIAIGDKRFSLSFSSGFVNSTGIPTWYRVNAEEMSLDSLLNQVGDDFDMDYFAYIDYDTYTADTGVISTIQIKDIRRTAATGSMEIDNFISDRIASGTLISYQRGQELRSDPVNVICYGDDKRYWFSPTEAQGQFVRPCWGRDNVGNVIWGNDAARLVNMPGYPNGTSPDSSGLYTEGIVLLDHIEGSGSERLDRYRVRYPQITIQYVGGVSTYPPTTLRVFTTASTRGYRPCPIVLQAALYSKEAWEAMVYRYHPIFSSGVLGIFRSRFKQQQVDFDTLPEDQKGMCFLDVKGSGITDRRPSQQDIIDAVFDATKEVAENYYGKTFIVNLPTSTLLSENTYNASEPFPRIEYEVIDSSWSEYQLGVPSGAGQFNTLHNTHNAAFKDDLNRIKSFVAIPSFSGTTNPFGLPIDGSKMTRESILIDSYQNSLLMPIDVEQYEKDPDTAIITLPYVVQPIPFSTNNDALASGYTFCKFLFGMGYDLETIFKYNLVAKAGDNKDYGLAMPRLSTIETTAGQKGVHIALKDNFSTYGPFIALTGSAAGCKIIRDNSLAPWTYGNYANMTDAGTTLANRAVSNSRVLDLAELSIAGLPEFNLGDSVGNNANVTALNISTSPDGGFVTSYSIRTFSIPANKVSKLLQDKITRIYNESVQTKEKRKLISDKDKTGLVTNVRFGQVIYPENHREQGQTNTPNNTCMFQRRGKIRISV